MLKPCEAVVRVATLGLRPTYAGKQYMKSAPQIGTICIQKLQKIFKLEIGRPVDSRCE